MAGYILSRVLLRGTEEYLPPLKSGQIAYSTDTGRLWTGTSGTLSGNTVIGTTWHDPVVEVLSGVDLNSAGTYSGVSGGNRVLVKDGADPGIYVYNGSGNPFIKQTDSSAAGASTLNNVPYSSVSCIPTSSNSLNGGIWQLIPGQGWTQISGSGAALQLKSAVGEGNPSSTTVLAGGNLIFRGTGNIDKVSLTKSGANVTLEIGSTQSFSLSTHNHDGNYLKLDSGAGTQNLTGNFKLNGSDFVTDSTVEDIVLSAVGPAVEAAFGEYEFPVFDGTNEGFIEWTGLGSKTDSFLRGDGSWEDLSERFVPMSGDAIVGGYIDYSGTVSGEMGVNTLTPKSYVDASYLSVVESLDHYIPLSDMDQASPATMDSPLLRRTRISSTDIAAGDTLATGSIYIVYEE